AGPSAPPRAPRRGRARLLLASSHLPTRTGRIMAKGLGVLPTDYDGDGDVDFLVANDSVPNFLWRNLGGGRFEDAALEAGVALNTHPRSEACIGIDGGDVDGDGHIDYFMTNYAEETDTLYRGEGDGFFFDGTYKAGLVEATYKPLGFGTRLFDYDLDGDLDIYVTRGHIVQLIAELQPGKGLSYEQPDQLLENDGRGRFKDISARSGAWFSKRFVGRGAAFGDYDNDGDIDVYIVNLSQKGVLLRNNTIESGRGGWVGLALRGGGPCNRDAYGSRVELTAAGRTRVAEVRSAASYLVANDPRVVFGLAAAPVAGLQARVRWADGLVEVFENLETGRYQDLQRGKGRAAR
ncbi:MAG: CRTAC1 family protein, partial [Planctomycetes bacterium]|nr:CRTAC1 family protein [Planctomycetota bacterium]